MNLKRNNIANSSQPYTLPSRSKADTQTKTCQRVWLPQHTVRLRIIKHENTTRGIKHWGLSGYSSILPRIRFGVTGQESSPQSPTISYRQTLATNRKKMKRIILEDTFTFIQKFMIIFIPSFIILSLIEKRNFQIDLFLDGMNLIVLLVILIFSRIKTGLTIKSGIVYKGFYFAEKLIINRTELSEIQ